MGGLREAARFLMAVRRTGRGVMRGRLGLPEFNRFLLGSCWSRDPAAERERMASKSHRLRQSGATSSKSCRIRLGIASANGTKTFRLYSLCDIVSSITCRVGKKGRMSQIECDNLEGSGWSRQHRNLSIYAPTAGGRSLDVNATCTCSERMMRCLRSQSSLWEHSTSR